MSWNSDGPYTIELDYDGTTITWSCMYAADKTFHISAGDETVALHRAAEREAVSPQSERSS